MKSRRTTRPLLYLALLTGLIPTGSPFQDIDAISGRTLETFRCAPSGSELNITGSHSTNAVPTVWGEAYVERCDGVNVNLEEGDKVQNGEVAARICAVTGLIPADIGFMTRRLKATEASTEDGFLHSCLTEGDGVTPRTVMQMDAARDVITVFVGRGGHAEECIHKLEGGGLTLDRLRWMYSGLGTERLVNNGWDADSIPNRDGKGKTHRWSELHPNCSDSEIAITGMMSSSGTSTHFENKVFGGDNEDFDSERYMPNEEEDMVRFVQENGHAIGFMGFVQYESHNKTLVKVPIEDKDGRMVKPCQDTINSGRYDHMIEDLYMVALVDEASMEAVQSFLSFGLSDNGSALVPTAGFYPLSLDTRQSILAKTDAVFIADSAISNPSFRGCGTPSIDSTDGGLIKIAGSKLVNAVVLLWSEIYKLDCHGMQFEIEGRVSALGIERICTDPSVGPSAIIASPTRQWTSSEKRDQFGDAWNYDCMRGDPSRSVAEFPIATDGVTILTKKGGTVDECVSHLGGLTPDQLRWIVSSYTAKELSDTGWDPSSLPNSDNDEDTHMWSELHPSCPDIEAMVYGVEPGTDTYEYFLESILTDRSQGESFDFTWEEDTGEGVDYLTAFDDTVGFFPYRYYEQHQDRLSAISIQNKYDKYVAPSEMAFVDGTYHPLGRAMFLNLYEDADALRITLPFLEFGYSDAGQAAVRSVGFSPISTRLLTQIRMVRLSTLYHRHIWTAEEKAEHWCDDSHLYQNDPSLARNTPTVTVAGSATIFPIMIGWSNTLLQMCPDFKIDLNGFVSAKGARRVCADNEAGSPVMIASMSRGFKAAEASPTGTGYTYDCLVGDTGISVTQLPLAIGGLPVVVAAEGVANDCIRLMNGGGLTLSQLRWIYSSYTVEQLVASNWDPSSLPNSDDDDRTHLWSELHPSCSATEILFAGAIQDSVNYNLFKRTVFLDYDNGELPDPDRYFASPNERTVAKYIEQSPSVIGYLDFGTYIEYQETLSVTGIQNAQSGIYVKPTLETIADGTYDSLISPLYMSVNNAYIKEVYTLLKFAYSGEGSKVIREKGYVPVSNSSPAWQKIWTLL